VSETKKPEKIELTIQQLAELTKNVAGQILSQAKDAIPKEADEWRVANEPFKTEEVKQAEKYAKLISKPSLAVEKKTIEVLKTDTFIDDLFLTHDAKSLGGIPLVIQLGVVGLPDVGKSILAQEIALRCAANGLKVVFVSSEDIWESPNLRYDLQSRMKEKADIMKLDWEKIKDHLFVFDTITYSEFRDWHTFVEAYRYLNEKEKGIDILIMDSITLMESYRGALKYRLLELARYNQLHGITAIYVCQRAIEESDKYAMAGGIGLPHNLDATLCIDFKKASGQIKADLNKKQWELVHFARMLGCRLCNFDRKYHELKITSDGFLKLVQ